MVAMARSLKKVNAEIKKQIGNYTLRKGLGYFYVTSDNPIKDLKLSGLFTASIQVCHLNHQSIEQWLLDVKEIVSNSENVECKANAKLIKAAPELLEALNRFLEDYEGQSAERHSVVGIARAAVKKATL